MTLHLDNNETHLLRTILKVEYTRTTTISYADEIKPLSDCIERLLQKLESRSRSNSEEQRNARLRRA